MDNGFNGGKCRGNILDLVSCFRDRMYYNFLLDLPFIYATRLKNDLVEVRVYGFGVDDDGCCIVNLSSRREDIMEDIISYWIVAQFVLRDASKRGNAVAFHNARMMYALSLWYFPREVSCAYGQSVERTLSMFHHIKPNDSTEIIYHLYDEFIVKDALDRYINSGVFHADPRVVFAPFPWRDGLTGIGSWSSLEALSSAFHEEDAQAVQSFRWKNLGFDPARDDLQRDVISFVLSLEKKKHLKKHGECAICYEAGDDIVSTRCKHDFCRRCLDIWSQINCTCPYCRCELE